MSTRRFCDFCGADITSDASHQGNVDGETTLRRHDSPQRYSIRVGIQVKFGENDGKPDICTGCVFGAVHHIDPTTQVVDS